MVNPLCGNDGATTITAEPLKSWLRKSGTATTIQLIGDWSMLPATGPGQVTDGMIATMTALLILMV